MPDEDVGRESLQKESIMKKTIREMAKGEFFTRMATDEPTMHQVWVRGDYDRATKMFECYKWDDTNHTSFLKGNREMYVGFTF